MITGNALDLETVKRRVDDDGYCVIHNVLSDAELAAARSAVVRLRSEDEAAGTARRYGPRLSNQRIWDVLNRAEEFVPLAAHPALIAIMRALLGPDALISNVAVNITGPGGDEGIGTLHADQSFLPNLFPHKLIYNTAFFLDDFTEENGATVYLPNSHRISEPAPAEMPPRHQLRQMTGPAGSLAVWDGFIHHATGRNRTQDQERRGVFTVFCAPFLRTQENWVRSLDPKLLEKCPHLGKLMGFEEWMSLGGVHGGRLAQAGLNY